MKKSNIIGQKTKTEQRREIVNFFYHHFVMKYHLKQTKQFLIQKKNFNLYQQEVINFIIKNFENIITLIDKNLSKEWVFKEIANLEKAVLVVSVAEFFKKAITKEVIITEAVKLVQKFSSFSAYTYVNKVLDTILTTENQKLFG